MDIGVIVGLAMKWKFLLSSITSNYSVHTFFFVDYMALDIVIDITITL